MASRSTRSVLLFIGVWCGASVLACGAGIALFAWSASRARDVRESSASAESIEDAQLRYRLHRPGPGWRLVEREEAARMNADAEAMAIYPDAEAGGVITVERAYGADLPRATDMLVGVYAEAGFDLDAPVAAALSGHEAMRVSGYGELRGMPVRIEIAIVVREDHIYQLYGWWPEPSDEPEQLTTHLLPALELLEGPVIDAPRRAPAADVDGALVQVRDGTVASAAYAVRIRGGEGWFVEVGNDLARSDPGAEMGLVREQPEIYLVVRATILPGADPAQVRLRTRGAAMFDASDTGVVETTHVVAGAQVPFTRFRTEHGIPLEHAHGVAFAGDRALEIHAWSAAPGALDAHLADGLARIELLTDAERDALEIASPGSRTDQLAEGIALRGGVFRGYPWNLVWRAPSPCWRGFVGEAATARDDGAALVVECPRHASHGELWIEPRDPELDDAAHHRLLVEDLFGSTFTTAPAAMGDAPAIESHGSYEVDGASWTFTVRSTMIGHEHVAWATWRGDGAPGGADQVRAALDAMRVDRDAPPEITSAPGYFEDRRLGFAIGDRASGVTFEAMPVSTSYSSVVSAVVPGGVVEVFAAHTGGARSGALAVDVMRERAAREGGGVFVPETSTGTLAGEPCDVLTWISRRRRHEMHSVTRGDVLYGVYVTSRLVGAPDARWRSTFRFVDP